jgi:hypothetical protein
MDQRFAWQKPLYARSNVSERELKLLPSLMRSSPGKYRRNQGAAWPDLIHRAGFFEQVAGTFDNDWHGRVDPGGTVVCQDIIGGGEVIVTSARSSWLSVVGAAP